MSTPTRVAMFNAFTEAPIWPTTRHYTRKAVDTSDLASLSPDAEGQVLWLTDETYKFYVGTGTSAGNWASGMSAQFGTFQQLQAGGVRTALSIKTATYTLTTSDHTIIADATGGAFTLNLPTAVGIDGQVFSIMRRDASGNNVTIDPNGAQTINGNGSITLDVQWDTVTIQSDGANWVILAQIDLI